MKPVQNEVPTFNLKQLINRLVATYQPVATDQNSSFVNEVSPSLDVKTDPETLSTILGSLIYLVARCSRDTLIKIKAATCGSEIVLNLKDGNPGNNYGILHDLLQSKFISWKIGGNLTINSSGNGSLVSFGFINTHTARQIPGPGKLQRA